LPTLLRLGATIDAATNTEVFQTFINDCLAALLRPGMVVVMDNLSSHKVSGVQKAIESRGCRVVYLPPYSPDMSPIENVFSKAKSIVRELEPRTVPDVEAAVTLALESITAADCAHCFTACGYTLPRC
jgi:transposase